VYVSCRITQLFGQVIFHSHESSERTSHSRQNMPLGKECFIFFRCELNREAEIFIRSYIPREQLNGCLYVKSNVISIESSLFPAGSVSQMSVFTQPARNHSLWSPFQDEFLLWFCFRTVTYVSPCETKGDIKLSVLMHWASNIQQIFCVSLLFPSLMLIILPVSAFWLLLP
jgi:hypothetical protein